AFVGGTIELVQEGDSITIDALQLLLQLNVDDAELARRRETAGFPVPQAQTPWQELYRRFVGQVSTGGCLEPATLYLKVIEQRGNPRHSH
ncbi:dihydroxy-acid dehydratase, partial [Clostridioides difficile]|nr:dihydroxy-acid dehydratase [Clostridioides difficile]